MVPRLLIPSEWLADLQNLPRLAAVVVFLVSLGMLLFGLRHHRVFIAVLGAAAGYLGGIQLAALMHVTAWFVAVPASLVAGAIVWPIGRRLVVVLIGFAGGCALGAFLTYGLRIANFWLGFGIGTGAGLLMALLAFRFASVVLFGSLGALGILGTLPPITGAQNGFLAPGAYHSYGIAYAVVGVVLFLVSLAAQVSLEGDRPQ